jgi:Na+-transporting NADH:ubiquinone oxidoreductase subunit C
MKVDGTVYTLIFSFVIGFVFVFVLAFVNAGTADQISLNQELAQKRAVLNAFGIEYATPEEVIAIYDEQVETVRKGDEEFYRATVDGEPAIAHRFLRNALWGDVMGVLAVNQDVTRTLGLEIIEHNETPGLGGRIDEPWFKEQFRNEKIENGTITVDIRSAGSGDTDHENATVDAVSGATLTSRYMQDIITAEIELIRTTLEANS